MANSYSFTRFEIIEHFGFIIVYIFDYVFFDTSVIAMTFHFRKPSDINHKLQLSFKNTNFIIPQFHCAQHNRRRSRLGRKPKLMIQCSPKLPKSLILSVFREVIIPHSWQYATHRPAWCQVFAKHIRYKRQLDFRSIAPPLSQSDFYKKTPRKVTFQGVFLADRVGFEPTVPWGTPDFEQKAISSAPPLSVPEMCNISICSARNRKTNDFLREICEIDARNLSKPLCVLGQRKHKENKNEPRKTKRSISKDAQKMSWYPNPNESGSVVTRGKNTIYAALKNGEIESYTYKGGYIFTKDAFIDYLVRTTNDKGRGYSIRGDKKCWTVYRKCCRANRCGVLCISANVNVLGCSTTALSNARTPAREQENTPWWRKTCSPT